ncbi:phosphopantetheine-binding protein [Flavobacterium cerinum]|uniref:Acyl carrier protein n=1 Tax=Flavobacterium cerinum TaxID=2502784 RepID=A0A3S3U2V9_9FLAO|nr:phosphopantetheine-binding protein [Flavobacterium cerinum]RWX00392.1 acyl carrier protein [Flavobacterium cerinum]
MKREEIIEKLKTIVKPYVNNQEAYENMNESSDFIKDLGVNSANLVDIVLDVEEQFNIVIDNPEMERMLDVKTAIDIIEVKTE